MSSSCFVSLANFQDHLRQKQYLLSILYIFLQVTCALDVVYEQLSVIESLRLSSDEIKCAKIE
jgi:flagellar biosynthesis protein FlhB